MVKHKELDREKKEENNFENPTNMNRLKLPKGRMACFYCYKELWSANYKEHLKICIYKNDFNLPKKDVLEKVFPQKYLKTELEMKYDTILETVLIGLKQIKNSVDPIIDKLEVKDNKKESPIEKIKRIVVKENTQKGYISEWNTFTQYLKKYDKKLSKDTADDYISHLNQTGRNTISTIKKKKNTLEKVLTRVLGKKIELERINKRSTFKEKYPMTEKDITNYLSEQLKINFEDYIIQRLCITFRLRINTIALFKLCHFDFLKGGNTIYIPDIKRNKVDPDVIDEDFAKLVKNFIKEKEKGLNITFQPNDYIFSPLQGLEEIRIKQINKRINKRIHDSKVFNFNLPFTFSSHMFRKTQVYNDFNEKLENIKKEARKKLRHTADTNAVNHYIGFAN